MEGGNDITQVQPTMIVKPRKSGGFMGRIKRGLQMEATDGNDTFEDDDYDLKARK